MYEIIRDIYFFIFVFISIYFWYKTKKRLKKWIRVVYIIAILAIPQVIITLFPIENYFYGFESPKEVFDYSVKKDYKEIVASVSTGKTAVFIVKNNDDIYTYYPYSRSDKGWMLKSLFESHNNVMPIDYDFTVDAIYSSRTNECIIIVDDYSEKPLNLKISDSMKSTFKKLKTDDNEIHYYTYFTVDNPNYKIKINNHTINLNVTKWSF